ncbi:MAG TPA: AAA family ATPase [Candidatus Lokiarchaeia archaeon]
MLFDRNFLIGLSGLPASGKSTFAYAFSQFFEKKNSKMKIIIVDPDNIRKELSPKKFDYFKEKTVRKKNRKAIKKSLKEGFIVISDDLNYYSSMRHELKKVADRLNLEFYFVYISTPLKVCLKWNDIRGNPIPESVIKGINQKFDQFGKYRWDVPILELDFSTDIDINEPIERLIDLIKNDQKAKIEGESNKQICSIRASNYSNEKLDIITRKIVGEVLQNSKFHYLKSEIIKYRKQFVKNRFKNPINETEISNEFKSYLEKNLNVKVF